MVTDLDRLLTEAEIVVVTVPLTPETVGMIGGKELAAMRREAILINVSRGPVVNEAALYAALTTQRIAGAALDVWWSYPVDGAEGRPSTLPFDQLHNVLVTPHSSGITMETYMRRIEDIAANIHRWVKGVPLANVVRATPQQPDSPSDIRLDAPGHS